MRYIDDTLLLFENVQQVKGYTQYQNSQLMDIKFHSEIEIENSRSFRHIKIVRIDGQFIKSVYNSTVSHSTVFTDCEMQIWKSPYMFVFM